jgi:hypothetical protein
MRQALIALAGGEMYWLMGLLSNNSYKAAGGDARQCATAQMWAGPNLVEPDQCDRFKFYPADATAQDSRLPEATAYVGEKSLF